MKRACVVVAMMLSLLFSTTPLAVAAPYISCPGGYIAKSGDECPPFQTPISIHPGYGGGGAPIGGGPHTGGGLLGTVGRVLGGLTGGLL